MKTILFIFFLQGCILAGCKCRGSSSEARENRLKAREQADLPGQHETQASENKTKDDFVYQEFIRALNKRNLTIKSKEDEDTYVVSIGELDNHIFLGNIREEFLRDNDKQAVEDFFNAVFTPAESPGRWKDARPGILFKAESSSHYIFDNFPGAVFEKVTERFNKVVVFSSSDKAIIHWVTKSNIENWKVDKKELFETASVNMAKLLDETTIEETDIDGAKVVIFNTEYLPFKASLIFAPNFKSRISRHLDWPVLAVVPSRDFVYVFSEKDERILQGLGGIVLEVYQESGYPVTTEIIKIDDKGISSIGYFYLAGVS